MARLPTLGGDNGTWGQILNEFLLREHNDDGTLKKAGDIQTALTTAQAAIPSSQKGAANGVASLDANGRLTNTQIPTSLDLTNRIVQVNKNQDNTWPSRPSAERVMWVGPGNPDPPFTTSGDVWIDTTP